jgi:hypothetical protein
MSPENKGSRIADDFPSIAARLRELNTQFRQVATQLECGACDNRGWVWSATALDWRRCPHCGMSRGLPKPQPRR